MVLPPDRSDLRGPEFTKTGSIKNKKEIKKSELTVLPGPMPFTTTLTNERPLSTAFCRVKKKGRNKAGS